MKKTIAILLVLVLAGVGLFADVLVTSSPVSLELTTQVLQLHLFKITSADLSADSLFTAFVTKAGDNVSSREVDPDDGIATTYLTMATNSTTGFTVQVDATTSKLTSPTVTGTPIDYTITCNSNSYDTSVAVPANVDLLTVARTAGSPAEVTSEAITVVIDAESYQNAAQATDYSAIVKLVIKGA